MNAARFADRSASSAHVGCLAAVLLLRSRSASVSGFDSLTFDSSSLPHWNKRMVKTWHRAFFVSVIVSCFRNCENTKRSTELVRPDTIYNRAASTRLWAKGLFARCTAVPLLSGREIENRLEPVEEGVIDIGFEVGRKNCDTAEVFDPLQQIADFLIRVALVRIFDRVCLPKMASRREAQKHESDHGMCEYS
jgi:hypothetical protein